MANNRPSSSYLTHPYLVTSGFTLFEMKLLWVGTLLATTLLCFITGAFIGQKLLMLIPVLPLSWGMVKLVVMKVRPIKERKVYGYASIALRLWLARYVGLHSPYVTRLGRWITRC